MISTYSTSVPTVLAENSLIFRPIRQYAAPGNYDVINAHPFVIASSIGCDDTDLNLSSSYAATPGNCTLTGVTG